MILLRRELGDVLREQRQSQGRTLREVSACRVACRSATSARSSAARRKPPPSCSPRSAGRCDLPLSEVLEPGLRAGRRDRGAHRAGVAAASGRRAMVSASAA